MAKRMAMAFTAKTNDEPKPEEPPHLAQDEVSQPRFTYGPPQHTLPQPDGPTRFYALPD